MEPKYIHMNNDDLTGMIIETNRDVKWICRALTQMKVADEELELRVRELEAWKAEHVGVEKKMAVWAGAVGAVLGVIAGVVLEMVI